MGTTSCIKATSSRNTLLVQIQPTFQTFFTGMRLVSIDLDKHGAACSDYKRGSKQPLVSSRPTPVLWMSFRVLTSMTQVPSGTLRRPTLVKDTPVLSEIVITGPAQMKTFASIQRVTITIIETV